MATEVVVMLRRHGRTCCRSSNGKRGKSKRGGAGVMVVVEWYLYSKMAGQTKEGFKHDEQRRHGVLTREKSVVCVHHSNKINTVW